MKQQFGLRIIIVAGVLLLSLWTLRPTWMVWSVPQDFEKPIADQRRATYIKENPDIAKQAVSLGLDLAGGTHIVVEVDDSKIDESQKRDLLDRCLEILRNRIDQYGVSEPVINKSGEKRIVAELAGVDAEAARRLIGATAQLEFKLVAEVTDFKPVLDRIDNYMKKKSGLAVDSVVESSDTVQAMTDLFGAVVESPTGEGDTSGVLDSLFAGGEEESMDSFLSRPFGAMLIPIGSGVGVRVEDIPKVKKILDLPGIQALIPKKFQFLWGRETVDLRGGKKARELYFLKRRAEMTGKYVSDAQAQRNPNGEIEVSLTFKGKGPKEFGRITGANIKRNLAIVLDSVVYSAPTIQGKITQGRASITGIGDILEATLLATTLRAGSLPAPMQIVELRSVGPTLGLANIKKGLQSILLGFGLVVLFMILYYRGAGLVAIVALFFNLVIIGAVLSFAHATLTLPGIAGIILTIGMAVDANVIIFERIKEELLAGRSVRGSIDAGYKRAFTAIFDSNITTFGTALILYNIGTGPIRGFGLTLMVGIAASMFTALYVTRLIFNIYVSRIDIKSLSIGTGLKFLTHLNVDFISKSRLFATFSLIVVVGTFAAVAFIGPKWGIDFTGGNVYQVQFEKEPDVEKIRSSVAGLGLGNPKVQRIGTGTENEVLIHIEKAADDSVARSQINKAVADGKVIGEESVGPTIGKELGKSAIWSLVLALILIVIYIWIRFGKNGLGFGLAAVVALAHDSLITWGIFGITGIEISLTFVAAVMTIVGYSLNDTIVIFDRIRENLEISGKEGFALKVNKAINQSMSRTLMTSLTTLIVVVVMMLFGGGAIQGFAVAMTIGIVVGTYSSIYVASPFVIWWSQRSAKGIQISKRKR